MSIIRIDKDKLEAEIAEIDHVLSKFEQTGMLMTTAMYATRNAYKKVLSMAILSEKKEVISNQVKLKL